MERIADDLTGEDADERVARYTDSPHLTHEMCLNAGGLLKPVAPEPVPYRVLSQEDIDELLAAGAPSGTYDSRDWAKVTMFPEGDMEWIANNPKTKELGDLK